jgi:hypothetical protein
VWEREKIERRAAVIALSSVQKTIERTVAVTGREREREITHRDR